MSSINVVEQISTALTAGMNIIVVGELGTGRVALARDAANNVGLDNSIVLLNQLEKGDITGVSSFFYDGAGKPYVQYGRGIKDRTESVMILDEIDHATHDVVDVVREIVSTGSFRGEGFSNVSSFVVIVSPDSEVLKDHAFIERFVRVDLVAS